MSDDRPKDSQSKPQKCRSLRWDKSTWHEYKPVEPDHMFRGRYTERCIKCGNERTVEVVQ